MKPQSKDDTHDNFHLVSTTASRDPISIDRNEFESIRDSKNRFLNAIEIEERFDFINQNEKIWKNYVESLPELLGIANDWNKSMDALLKLSLIHI